MDAKTIFTVIVRALLVSAGGALASHGVIQASGVEQFVSIGLSIALVLGGICWSVWDKWGRPIAEAQLEIWKLKALSRAEALRNAGVAVPPPPTVAQVDAATSSSVTPAVAAKALETTIKAAVLLAFFVVWSAPVFAQNVGPSNIGRVLQDTAKKNDANAVNTTAPAATSSMENPLEKLKADALADLKYAAALADKAGNTVTAGCWHAWVNLLETQQTPVTDKDGKTLPEPSPDLFTSVEKVSELRAALQQGGPIQTACAPLASAIKMDIGNLVGKILGGGIGLAKLIPIVP